MGFEPGNPYGAMTKGIPRPHNRELRKATRSLAMSIRDGVHPDTIRDWLIGVWMGKDPVTGEVVPLELRMHALKMLTDRGWGQAAQMLVLEGEIRQELNIAAPTSERPPMTLEEINARRAELRRVLELPAGALGEGGASR